VFLSSPGGITTSSVIAFAEGKTVADIITTITNKVPDE
jgi:hypothetical protein